MSSSTSGAPVYAAPDLTLPATANFSIAAIVFVLFVLSALLGAERKHITQGFDEVAHTSYVAAIQHSGNAWPALQQMRLLDPRTFQFTDQANYLNHPPLYYAMHAVLGPKLEGRPQALLAHRLIDIAIAAIGFAALLAIGLAARFPRYEFYAYAIPLACIPVLAPIAGSINNDNLAFLGGAFATLGVWQCVSTGRRVWFALALVGMVAASWAKLTGLLLTGGMVSGAIAYLLWQRRLPWSWAAAALLVLLLAAAPYLVFIWQYGSPTPETPAQIALIKDGARVAGWSDLPRRSFPVYLFYFVTAFAAEWMPTLAARNVLNYAMLSIPAAALACAFAGIALSVHRLWRRTESALDVVVLAGALAFVGTFAIHVVYSYGRYAATGWLMDAYPRYYLPLAALVPLACLSLLAAIESPRWRGALLGFLIAAPIVFRLFGAPLG
jgi:hypothetical protein